MTPDQEGLNRKRSDRESGRQSSARPSKRSNRVSVIIAHPRRIEALQWMGRERSRGILNYELIYLLA